MQNTSEVAGKSSLAQNSIASIAPKLTRRELDVVRLICNELSTKQIASRLHIAPETVEFHKTNIAKKLNTVATIIRWAIRNRLIEA